MTEPLAPVKMPVVGDVVVYSLDDYDVQRVNYCRSRAAICYNEVQSGQQYPGIVTLPVSADELVVNIHLLLDGDDTHWVSDVSNGPSSGQWQWPKDAAS